MGAAFSDGLPADAALGEAGPADDAAAAARPADGAVALGAGVARRAGGAVTVGALTGAALLAVSPGVYTGGSSRTVYSRIRRPRAQFTSTRNVTKGSGMASVECTSKGSGPSLPLPTLKVNVDRNGGRSMP